MKRNPLSQWLAAHHLNAGDPLECFSTLVDPEGTLVPIKVEQTFALCGLSGMNRMLQFFVSHSGVRVAVEEGDNTLDILGRRRSGTREGSGQLHG
ncbi:hypothetical protein [Paraburkholderia graminis]|uniref:hypothetical protein n=1 Tax=Paraburkholderia graminis TaxID=60548 RepID=UPI0038B76EF6